MMVDNVNHQTGNNHDEKLDNTGRYASWTPIANVRHVANDITFSYHDAGGGGDCLFHSVACALGNGRDANMMRASAARAVNASNVRDVLMDMAAQYPQTKDDRMDIPPNQHAGQFSPETVWNMGTDAPSASSDNVMIDALRRSLTSPGNHMWGDATVASLLEISENVNIILMAKDMGVSIPPTTWEIDTARTIFSVWVEHSLRDNIALRGTNNLTVLDWMRSRNLTWNRAVQVSRKMYDTENGHSWLRGRRQPIGTVRTMYTNPTSGNISTFGYSRNRPTILLWNVSNVHWMPIGVGPNFSTIIHPNSPFRSKIDSLLSS